MRAGDWAVVGFATAMVALLAGARVVSTACDAAVAALVGSDVALWVGRRIVGRRRLNADSASYLFAADGNSGVDGGAIVVSGVVIGGIVGAARFCDAAAAV